MNISIQKVMAVTCCLTLFLSAFIVTGCSKNEDDMPSNENVAGKDTTVVSDTIIDSTPRPTDWIVAEGSYYPESMLILIDSAGAPVPMQKGDRIAAFIGTECRGAADVQDDGAGYLFSYFSVRITQEESLLTDLNVELRYYSSHNMRIYRSLPFPYDMTGKGKPYNGYQPSWQK